MSEAELAFLKSSRIDSEKEIKKSEMDTVLIEQSNIYEKRIYDLEQLIDIAKSFCSTLDFSNLLESIVYICMAQMHVLGAEIFVRDSINNDVFILETSKTQNPKEEKITIPGNTEITSKLLELHKPVTLNELKESIGNCKYLSVIENLMPTLIVPLIEKEKHLNGIIILQERIAIEDETTYTDYEQKMIMSIAQLATVAINNASLMERSSTDMMTHLR